MCRFTDQQTLLKDQYRDDANLQARIALHHLFSVSKIGWPLWMFEQLEAPPQARILEIGCGPASLWRENGRRIPASWRITLTDFSPGMVRAARQSLATLDIQVGYANLDAQALAFEDNTFDVVIANHMLYHVPDREHAFANIRRVLRPGGRLYAATNGRNHMRELGEIALRFEPNLEQQHAAGQFGLENGGKQLAGYFERVELRRFADALEVTAAEPLVAYLLSMRSLRRSQFVWENRQKVTSYLESEFEKKGSIHITKDTGLFIAHN